MTQCCFFELQKPIKPICDKSTKYKKKRAKETEKRNTIKKQKKNNVKTKKLQKLDRFLINILSPLYSRGLGTRTIREYL